MPAIGDVNAAAQCLCQSIAICLGNTEVIAAVSREFVRFVKDDQVVWLDAGLAELGKHSRAGECVDADDEAVTVCAGERIGVARVGTCDDTELKTEKCGEFALPVADEAGGGDDQNAFDESAGFHLAEVKARHDCLSGTGIVGEQEPQRKLL